jgi:MFS family permease
MTPEPTTEEKEMPAPAGGSHQTAAARQGWLAVLRVLRRREFAIFFAGQSISQIGTWMQVFAQGWVVTGLTTSAFALGLVNFASSIPTLLLMPFGGVAADRQDRRKILIWTQWVMLFLAVAMGVLIATDRLQLWHLYVIALLLGVATAYDLPAYQSFYPQLVDREDMPQAISLSQAAFHGSRIIGPALAGVLVKLWGTAAAFFANAASFLAVIISLLFIRSRPPAEAGAGSAWNMMSEGFRYVRERPCLQALLGITGITTFFVFPNMAVLTPYYAKHVLHVGADGLGTIMTMSGAGALLGAVLLLTVLPEQRVGRIALAMATVAAMLSVLAWSRHLWLSAAAVSLQSVAIATSLGLVSIIVQEMVPDELRGRVMSLYSLMFMGVMPFASLLMTSLADWVGMRLELQISAFLYGLGACLLLWRLRRTWQEPGTTDQKASEPTRPAVAVADD